jgi:hypothetical protein
MCFVLVHIAMFSLLAAVLPASAQQEKVGVVDILEGSASLVRHPGGRRALILKEDIFALDSVETTGDSKLIIQFANHARIVLGHRTAMRISTESGRLILDLDNGVVNYRASPERNLSDELRAMRTPNVTATTTGRVVIKVTREVPAAVVTTVCALEGRAVVTGSKGTNTDVPEGNCVAIDGDTPGTLFPRPPVPGPVPLTNILSLLLDGKVVVSRHALLASAGSAYDDTCFEP